MTEVERFPITKDLSDYVYLQKEKLESFKGRDDAFSQIAFDEIANTLPFVKELLPSIDERVEEYSELLVSEHERVLNGKRFQFISLKDSLDEKKYEGLVSLVNELGMTKDYFDKQFSVSLNDKTVSTELKESPANLVMFLLVPGVTTLINVLGGENMYDNMGPALFYGMNTGFTLLSIGLGYLAYKISFSKNYILRFKDDLNGKVDYIKKELTEIESELEDRV